MKLSLILDWRPKHKILTIYQGDCSPDCSGQRSVGLTSNQKLEFGYEIPTAQSLSVS
jgi:hypothetical protein